MNLNWHNLVLKRSRPVRKDGFISKNLRTHLVRKMVMMILTGIMGMESMAIFSLGTFLSINLRLVMPEENFVDLHKVG